MYNEISDVIKTYYEKEKCADQDYVHDICDIICQKEDLKDYLKSIVFVHSKKLKKSPSNYSIGSRLLTIDIEHIIEFMGSKEEEIDNTFLISNMTVLFVLYHELTHVKQSKFFHENLYSDIVIKSITDFSYFNFDQPLGPLKYRISELYYHLNWFNDPMERMANLSACKKELETLKILEQKIDLKDLTIIPGIERNDAFHKVSCYKLKGDKTNNPTYNYLAKMPFSIKKEYLKIILDQGNSDNLSFEKRVFYGLPLTSDEFNNLMEDYEKKEANEKKLKLHI